MIRVNEVCGSSRLLKNIGGLWIFQHIHAALQRRNLSVTWDTMVLQADAAPPLYLRVEPDEPRFVAPNDMMARLDLMVKRPTNRKSPITERIIERQRVQ